MAIVVQKYGGSSVADLGKLRSVAARVVATRSAGHDVVVVVSAMGKTTESLLELARHAAQPACADAPAEPHRRELDMLLSTGERVSMALLSIAIHALGRDSVSFTGSQSGIITNDRHFDARIIEVRPHRIEDELSRGRIVIVAGYQGVSDRREITTLGRGGSDTTAVALAAALGAERCEIYSDVDGVYTADPRHVEDAQHLPAIGYDVMQEMAECGAKVLNAQAVEWARRHGIAIHARRTSDALDSGRETVVFGTPRGGAAPRAVVSERRLALVHAPAQAAGALLRAARDAELSLRDVRLDRLGWLAVVPLLNVPDLSRARRKLLEASPQVELRTELASVSLIGPEVGTCPEVLAGVLQEVDEPLALLCTPLRVSAVVAEARLSELERRFHALFVSRDQSGSRNAAARLPMRACTASS